MLALGGRGDPAQVGQQRTHRLGGQRADSLGVAAADAVAGEPRVQTGPVARVEPGCTAGPAPLRVDQPLAGVGPLAQGRDAGLHGQQRLGDLRHVPGDVIDEALQVVDERALEDLELLAVEVEPGQHPGQVGVELAGAVHQLVELHEHRADLAGQPLRLHRRQVGVVVGTQAEQPLQDAAEHLAAHLPRRLREAQQLLDVTLHQLAPLGELVAGPAAQVVGERAGLGLPGAAGQVAVLDEVGQARVDRVDVEVEALLGQAFLHLRGGLVGQETGQAGGEDAHHGEVLRGLLVDGVAQRLQTQPVDHRLAHLGHPVAHAAHLTRDR